MRDCLLVNGICGIDDGDGVLQDLDDRVVDQLSSGHKLVQLRGQHGKAVQMLAIGHQQSPAVVSLLSLDAFRAEDLHDWLSRLVLREHSLEVKLSVNYAELEDESIGPTSIEPLDRVLNDIVSN